MVKGAGRGSTVGVGVGMGVGTEGSRGRGQRHGCNEEGGVGGAKGAPEGVSTAEGTG